MKNPDKIVEILCPVCGNEKFELLEERPHQIPDWLGETCVTCTDCHFTTTKEDLLGENRAFLELVAALARYCLAVLESRGFPESFTWDQAQEQAPPLQ